MPTTQRIQLPTGAQANLQTLAQMAQVVREDAAFPDLAAWAFRDIIGTGDLETQITAAYEHCRDKIIDQPEADGFETIADIWSCHFGLNADHPVGDCAVKSTALCTLLCYLKLRPVFVALQQIPGADFYNHVCVGLRRADGSLEILDPTPPDFTRGQMLPCRRFLLYPIL